MTDQITEVIVNSETIKEETGPQSPIEALRVRREEVASHRETLIPLQGYEEMGLKAKYRLVEREETDRIAKNIRSQTKVRDEFMYRMVVETVALAVEGFVLAPDGVSDEQAEPLVDLEGNEVTNYNQLATALGWEPGERASHHRAMLFVFGDNEFAIGSHGLLLQRWLNNTTFEVTQEFLGE